MDRTDVRVKVELEAEDTLAVRLKSLRVEGPAAPGTAVRETLERQTRAILEGASYVDGELALIEVDGVSNAAQIRTKKPAEGRFVEFVLRGGNVITLEARGGTVHLSRENYERLEALLTALIP